MNIWLLFFVETHGMDLVSKEMNSLFRSNYGSLQGFNDLVETMYGSNKMPSYA